MSSQGYADQVLSGPLKNFLAYLEKEKGRKVLLVEDGSGPHRGKAAKAAREKYGIQQYPHPPYSPDLNPIEPVWKILKDRVAAIPDSANSLENLWSAVQTAWDSITVEDINKHTGKMAARVIAVAVAKGGQTRF
ncbi:hypothetical protein BDV93DRAFT_460393 [Ceratobasidium sp. AG-I]|nr:hypothetical protein BDV93DRAFT_460393 [Ceratobasidium sp. AG-I]